MLSTLPLILSSQDFCALAQDFCDISQTPIAMVQLMRNAANYLIIIDDITESGGLASPAFVVRGHELGGYGADAADELMAQVLVEELSRRMGIEVFPLPAVTVGENTSDGLRREPGPVEAAERDVLGPHQVRASNSMDGSE
ncbi:hypothetical protein HMPREF9946_03111 [Acetobacteraceae bacterium AT-5844]|nr:hypothetical protein HMPREF9946_03111 [Acetobacteraceae bacterium AT-5844]